MKFVNCLIFLFADFEKKKMSIKKKNIFRIPMDEFVNFNLITIMTKSTHFSF